MFFGEYGLPLLIMIQLFLFTSRSDGDWETSSKYWKSTEFLAWLYNESPVRDTVVTNDRWGSDTTCRHGGYLTCSDRYQPSQLMKRKWENAMTLDTKSWGFRHEASLSDYLTIQQLIGQLVKTVSCGGNILINVGPTKEGIITPIYEQLLLQLGHWLEVNGEAIYGSSPWSAQNDTVTANVWYTTNHGHVYATLLDLPRNNETIHLGSLPYWEGMSIVLLGQEHQKLTIRENGTNGTLVSGFNYDPQSASQYAYVFRIVSEQKSI